jgi:hypothetical protein
MAKFVKPITPLGDHMVSDSDGDRKKVTITKDRALHWINTFNQMKAKGLNVFAPWEHDLDNKPTKDTEDLLNAKNNAGQWTELYLEEDMLVGVVETESEEYIDKIGKTVKGCSLFADDYVDGEGQTWKDALLHICLTNRPVALTDNYSPLNKENNLSIAMSTSMKNKTSVLNNLVEKLKKLGVTVDPTEDVMVFLDRLTTAFSNVNFGGSVDSIPDNVTQKSPSMSLMMSTEAPKPEKNVELDSLVEKNKELEGKLDEYAAQFSKWEQTRIEEQKNQLEERVSNVKSLLEGEEDGKEVVNSLEKELKETEFKLDDNGKLIETGLHRELRVHEKWLPKKVTSIENNGSETPAGVQQHEMESEPEDGHIDMSPERLREAISLMPA